MNEGGYSSTTIKNNSNNLLSLAVPFSTAAPLKASPMGMIGSSGLVESIFSSDGELDNVHKWLEICDP